MRKDIGKWITLMVTLIGGSLSAFAYVHKTFVTKDVMALVINKLDKMDAKLDRLVERRK